ncbi:putative anti-sigma-M factor YhdL [Anoxybacillus sp. P3H1B]|nr:putative anti-sigma-M factor YhdL [Anoxybacillus sp. P3H1B]MBB3908165.1 RIO-like serine/threonine protein kinase [Anoxybacillus rupiensis]
MKDDLDFMQTPVIGFPYKKVHVDSVFNRSFTDYEEVVKGLELLTKNEKWATQLTEYKNLKMAERLKWVKKNKELKVYGIAITGTAKDVLSLEKMKEVHVIRLGQIYWP